MLVLVLKSAGAVFRNTLGVDSKLTWPKGPKSEAHRPDYGSL